jgi:signal peptidase II
LGKTLIIALVTLMLDQISKWYVVEYLDLKTKLAIDVLPPLLNFRMAWNAGINFGLFSNDTETMRWVLIVVALIVSLVLIWYARKFNGWLSALFLGCIVGGALGNVIDRIMYGAVADFLNMSCCGINNRYSFNIADATIFIGAFGLILFSDKLKKSA